MAIRPFIASPACQACVTGNDGRSELCQNAFGARGILRVNWDCWDNCNLGCPFCLRSRGAVLDTQKALQLIGSLAFGGVKHLTFTGGDPSLRRDLHILIDGAHGLDMQVEVLTNAQYQPEGVRSALLASDLVGLSLDGASSSHHDSFRCRRGNFARVCSLMNLLDEKHLPYVVRTVVSKVNFEEPERIALLLAPRPHLHRWSLQQFSPVEMGYQNRHLYEIAASDFADACERARQAFTGDTSKITVLSDEFKVGLYFLIDPQGRALSRVANAPNGHLPVIGDLLSDHLSAIASRLVFRRDRHALRYSGWFVGAK